MWQRIQTVYLVLIAVLMGIFAVSDLFILSSSGQALILDAWTLRDGGTGDTLGGIWGIGVLAVLSAVVAMVDLFLYRRRVLQARIGTLNAILLLGLIGLLFYAGYTYSSGASLGYKFVLALPVVSLILQVLAVRGILADETLVRVSNRLR